MRIKECRIGAFGHIHDCELKGLDSNLVVVLGPNETGKSTLFEFFKTMIYGIYPTSPEHHDYVPWSGRLMEGSLSFQLRDGSEQIVSRRLSKGPEGYILNGERRNIRNQTIPAATHISRELFDSVYALSLAEMASIRERPWHEIEERLLGELTLDVLRPIKSVVKELEDEAGSLWRESNRGKPQAKELEQQIKGLRQLAQSAVTHDSETRRLQEELERIETQLEEFRAKRLQLKSRLAWLEKLLPCRKLLTRIEECRRQAGDVTELRDLPENPEDRLLELRGVIGQLKERLARKGTEVSELQGQISSFTEEDRKFLELAPEIRDWASRSIRYGELLDRLAESREELAESRKRAGLVSARILSTELSEEIVGAILTVSERELSEAVKVLTETRTSLDEVQHDISAFRLAQSLLPSIFLSTLGFGLCVVTFFRAGDILLATGLSLFALGIAWSISVWLRKRQEERRLSRLRSESERGLERSSESIRELLSNTPVSEGRLAKPDLFLVNDIANLKAAVNEMRSRETTVTTLERRQSKMMEELTSWIKSLELNLQPVDFEAVKALEILLEGAAKREIQAGHFSVAEAGARDAVGLLTEELKSLTSELSRLESQLRDMGEGDLERGLKAADSRRSAFRAAEHFEKNLEEEYPDWESIQEEAASLDSQGVTEEIDGYKWELEEVAEQIQHLSSERMSRVKDIQHLQSQRTLPDLESEIAQLQLDLADVKFRHDRLLLLSRIIKHGDQRFRDRHQPDVLRRASEHLSLITGNRYVRLDLDKDSQGLEVLPVNQIHPIPVARPLSQGIRDQIYLSLRLALVEHLDDAYERLPLFLDEVLVNWDESRRHQGYAVFEKILSSRQVFVFTCHRWLAAEFIRELGGKQVEFSDS